MTNKDFTLYPEALELKQIGFDEPCLAWATLEYPNNIHIGNRYKTHRETDLPTKPFGVPTYSQAFRWFREKGYETWIPHNEEGYQFVIKWEFEHTGGIEVLRKINSHEEAELECLRDLIEIVKGGKK